MESDPVADVVESEEVSEEDMELASVESVEAPEAATVDSPLSGVAESSEDDSCMACVLTATEEFSSVELPPAELVDVPTEGPVATSVTAGTSSVDGELPAGVLVTALIASSVEPA